MECKTCGKKFVANVHNQKYCSLECKREIKNQKRKNEYVIKKCIFCEKEFSTNRSNKVSCGKRDKQHRPNEKVKTMPCKCSNCNNTFLKETGALNRNIKNDSKNFCSVECRKKFYEVELTCSTCGKEYFRRKSEVYGKNFHFCSRKCQDENLDYILRGEEHYCYIDGESKNSRGKGWNKIKKLIRERDNHICKKCGKTREEIGKELDVHHIEPYRNFTNSDKANEMKNLITLCPSCHHKEEIKIINLKRSEING